LIERFPGDSPPSGVSSGGRQIECVSTGGQAEKARNLEMDLHPLKRALGWIIPIERQPLLAVLDGKIDLMIRPFHEVRDLTAPTDSLGAVQGWLPAGFPRRQCAALAGAEEE
jgi:hypothetical protein